METIVQSYLSESKKEITPEPFQRDFLFSGARYPAFVAGWGTGKTMFGLLRGIILTEQIPNNLGLVVRKEYTDLKDSTIKDFERYTGRTVGSDKDVLYPNGSVIMFRHGSEIEVLKNINLGWFMIEQAEEFESDEVFAFLRGRLRRSEVPFHTGFIIANTAGHNWLWRIWKISPPSNDYPLFEATTFDNEKNLPQDYLNDLKTMEKDFPHHYRRYVMNSWEDLENYKSVIQHDWCLSAVNFRPSIFEGKRYGSCDPAFYGDDECVCDIWEDKKMLHQLVLRNLDAIEIAGRLLIWAREHKLELWGIETDGRGQDVLDAFRRLSEGTPYRVVGLRMADPPTSAQKEIQFLNLRAQIWWEAGKFFKEGTVGILNDPILIEQLSSVEYYFRGVSSKIQIEPKEKTKKRLGRSPDRADACVLGIYTHRFAKKVSFQNRLGDYEERKPHLVREMQGVSTAGY